ncbi:hypothetical protein MKX08_005768 [Trichoderma sp. CBMAI-0020]|nr:hypothetical protein MKX08_005768 [Trichoderma sp. CBMAI-0020]WOD46150.1 hypothetical protein [Trichoderma atroviride]
MNLDTLTVFGPAIPRWSHEDLDFFIKYGRGWKELRYITFTSAFVDMVSSNHGATITLPSEPQPAAWQRDLENRDGPNSGASVTMYKSADSKNPLSIMCSTLRTELSYPPTPTTGVDHLNADGISQSLDLKDDKRGILIVKSLNFLWVDTKENPTLTEEDMQRLYTAYGIDTIKFNPEDGARHNQELDRCSNVIEVDNYRHVDDYAFPPHPFRTEHFDP